MISLPRLNIGWDTQPGLFQRTWNSAMSAIEANISSIIANIAAITAAQTDATTALANAATAQSTATAAASSAASANTAASAANANANTRVLKSAGPAWTNATGTADRTGYAAYAGQTISNPPTQAQVQALDDAVKALSQHVVAIINDLKGNQSLT